MKASILMKSAVLLLATCATGLAQESYSAFTGPGGQEWSRMGTDGTDLYFTTGGRKLHRYTFPANSPSLGVWTQLTDCPRIINAWDSYRGLAFQNGYLYASAIPSSGGGRTIVRYQIATDTWEVWSAAGVDITICNTSGNALFMHPTLDGVGYSAWHAGFNWVQFDWNAQSANNTWMATAGRLGVLDDDWVSRNEEAVTDGSGTYFAVKNDRGNGLSAGDVVFTFDLNGSAGPIVLLAQKPFQSGAGSSLELIPSTHVLNTTGNDELWFYRGCDGLSSSMEGWGNAGTQDLGVLDLTALTWATYTTPFFQGNGTDSVLIGDHLFVKSSGSASSPTVYDDMFYVVTGAAGTPFCFGDQGSGTICPCGNDNDGSNGSAGCANSVFPGGAVLSGSGSASVSADSVVLSTAGLVPSQPGLYFQGDNAINSGNGVAFGDGLRCAGQNVIRLQVVASDGGGNSATSISISVEGMVNAGDTKHYQCWYRDPSGSPCGSGFNLSNGYTILWGA